VDEDVFFTASSRRTAERLLRSVRVDPGSWWRVECARLDDVEGTRADDRLANRYYSRAGKEISSPPQDQGYRAAILREKRNVRMLQGRLRTAVRDGLSKQVLKNLRRSLRSIQRVLSRHKH
jgi:hypothetical protein